MKGDEFYNEKELLHRLTLSDQQAFAEVYNRYHPAIYAYLVDFVKIPSLAEDLVHEAFLKLWEIRTKLQIRVSFSAYLYRISRNLAIDMMRKIAAEDELRTEIVHRMEQLLPETIRSAGQIKKYEELFEKAINALPPQRRKVFILCRENGRTYEEAAVELGISRNTVKEHMVHALRFLRTYIYENGEFIMLLLFLLNNG